jgi:hypothetical protein
MKISKLSKLFPHFHVVNSEDNRLFYTKHAYHLNGVGKKILLKFANLIFSLIKKISNMNTNIIPMGYYEMQTQSPKQINSMDDTLFQDRANKFRSRRVRKNQLKIQVIFYGKFKPNYDNWESSMY